MSNWPKVWLILATYKRTETALGTIDSLRKYLIYPNLHWHVADDGSGKTDDGTDRWHVGVLVDKIARFYPDVTWHEMNTPPGQFNTGGNINKGIFSAREDGSSIHMLVFDDWALLKELDVRPMVDVLDTYEDIGFIRLSYLTPGISGVCARYDSPRLNQNFLWLRLIRDWTLNNPWVSGEYFLVSTQPYIAHVRFFGHYGWHPENVAPGVTEEGLSWFYNYHRRGELGPQILSYIGPCTTHAPWGHMADRQHHYADLFE